jgi:hypothetical protein
MVYPWSISYVLADLARCLPTKLIWCVEAKEAVQYPPMTAVERFEDTKPHPKRGARQWKSPTVGSTENVGGKIGAQPIRCTAVRASL